MGGSGGGLGELWGVWGSSGRALGGSGTSLGFGGIFNPVFAAWGAILFFSSIGFYMIVTLDSEEVIQS